MAERTLEETTAGNGHHEDAPVPEPTTPRNESTLERLRAKRAEKAHEATPLELPIPGYDGELVCKYRPLTWGELKKIGEKVDKSKNPARELHAHCDTLILACEGFYVREEGQL